jgi:endo-1,4-beta-mannosidase
MKNLSTKELGYSNDMLSWELLASKKCYQYANQETNPVYRQLFFDVSKIAQQNYSHLLGFIEQAKNSQGGQTKQ